MNRFSWKSRLWSELTAVLILSLILAFGCFLVLQSIGYTLLDRYIPTETYYTRSEQNYASRLQTFVTNEQLSTHDTEQLDKWTKKENYVYLTLVQNGRVLYDSLGRQFPNSAGSELVFPDSGTRSVPLPEEDSPGTSSPLPNSYSTLYPIRFTDGVAQAGIVSFYGYQYYNWADLTAVGISLLAFILLFLFMIRKKISYIEQLREELTILEGGDLNYHVTVSGMDELAELALGINSMRRSILEREAGEQEARKANYDLVTSISHDLRSPLTSLLGYLDFLEQGFYDGEEQFSHFLHISHEKAIQIKDMSDQLFEYFLVYDKDSCHQELELVSAMTIAEQMICENVFELESKGYEVHQTMEEINCMLNVNIQMTRRIFDNLFRNIIKYADTAKPVDVRCWMENDGAGERRRGQMENDGTGRETRGQMENDGAGRKTRGQMENDGTGEGTRFCVELHNSKRPDKSSTESSGIGLKTCDRILQEHGGTFLVTETETDFTVCAIWPVSLP